MTQKNNRIFLHVLDWKEPLLIIPASIGKINKAYWFGEMGSTVKFKHTEDGIIINLRESKVNAIDRIIVLDLKSSSHQIIKNE